MIACVLDPFFLVWRRVKKEDQRSWGGCSWGVVMRIGTVQEDSSGGIFYALLLI